jgi:hypothetical protein
MTITLEDIINNKDKLDSSTQKTAGCWWFTGKKDAQGYGTIRINRSTKYVAAAAWEIFHGELVPEGFIVKAICANKICVNPNHLELARRTYPWRM